METIDLLVLDDEEKILEAIKRVFYNEKITVFATTSCKEALSTLENRKVKIIMSDYRMPEMNGVDFLNMAKNISPDSIRIIFTGYMDLRVAEEAINRDEVYKFLNKPWDEKEIKGIVKDAMEKFGMIDRNKALMRELEEKNAALLEYGERLKQMYEEQKNFSTTVSHELRTPLASMKAMLEIVLSETSGEINNDQRNFIGKALKNVDRLSGLINDILTLSKTESGNFSMQKEKKDISGIISEVVDMQRIVAERKGLFLKLKIEEKLPEILINPNKINQVMNNLLDNAIKFTEKGGITVTCGIDKEGKNIFVSVKDTGKGIKEEDKGQIFKKFHQLGDPSTDHASGTGLGLAICKEIILHHGGSIWVESVYGEGSVFKFNIPLEYLPGQKGEGYII